MREIKFRAFSKNANGMVFLEYAVYIVDDEIQPKNDYILMQYTGLKDKNGIEIYEGDILRNPIWVGADKNLLECIFTNGQWAFESIDYRVPAYNRSTEFEVIGNIYENQALLK